MSPFVETLYLGTGKHKRLSDRITEGGVMEGINFILSVICGELAMVIFFLGLIVNKK
jgi:hypothetical protein